MTVGCKMPINSVVYLLSFFTFVSTIGVHIACSCNRECAHPLEAWQSKLTSLGFFLAFFKPKERKKIKNRDLRTSLLPVPLLDIGLWCEFALHIFEALLFDKLMTHLEIATHLPSFACIITLTVFCLIL
jgi:hypothetical protein